MANDSSQAGYLLPSTNPAYDDDLDNIVYGLVVGLTGLPGDLVRPRWQPEPSTQPNYSIDWVAFGLNRSTVDAFAYESHDPSGAGPTKVERDELLYFLHSFYGPHAHGFCEQFRDGFEISQNRDAIKAVGLTLVEVQEPVKLPALLKEKWVPRIDVTVVYRRRTSRAYPVLTLRSGRVELTTEELGTSIINITNP